MNRRSWTIPLLVGLVAVAASQVMTAVRGQFLLADTLVTAGAVIALVAAIAYARRDRKEDSTGSEALRDDHKAVQ